MLVISRRAGESFWVGPETEVVIVGCEGGNVKLGVRAPKRVLILRSELKQVQEQNRSAAEICAEADLATLAERLRGC